MAKSRNLDVGNPADVPCLGAATLQDGLQPTTDPPLLTLPLAGSFNIPTGCTAGSLGVSYDKLFRLTFNSPQVPIMAVITKDPVGSMVSYFGTGSTQVCGRRPVRCREAGV